MKNLFLSAGALLLLAQVAFAQSRDQKMRLYSVDSVIVTSTRAGENTPTTHSTGYGNASASQVQTLRNIENPNIAVDIPFLLQSAPSVVATSDAGTGIGYTGMRIRGTDQTRINVTLDGVPMNEAESQGLFWVNMPDLVSSINSIQVERGVGTSTNGAGAFGGTVNMLLQNPSQKASATIAETYGSFNTWRQTLALNSGLLKEHWTLDARLSHINSDGYVRRSSVRNRSFFVRAGWQNYRTRISLYVLDGREKTGLAWDGISAEDMKTYGRRWNWLGMMADGNFYDNNTDNYHQTHYRANLRHDLGGPWSFSGTLHLTKGYGYYQEYKLGVDMAEYGLEGDEGDIIRRKMMDNIFGGGVFSLDFRNDKVEASLGGAANRYDGQSYGRVLHVENYAHSLDPNRRYYNGKGLKDDGNIYAKAVWEMAPRFYLYGDLQYRLVKYRVNGSTDSWINGSQYSPSVDKTFRFFNPKAGFTYRTTDDIRLYGSVAVAHREPPRNNYTEAPRFLDGKPVLPRPERLTDFELGASWREIGSSPISVWATIFYMDYKDQLVLNGETNDIGEALAENVPKSYRSGVELQARTEFSPTFYWDINATFSRNRIKNYYDPVGDRTLRSAQIAYSPSITLGSLLGKHFEINEGRFLSVGLQTLYVGSQYVTNFEQKALSLSDYCVSNLRLAYNIDRRQRITLQLEINNILDTKYASNGYGWDWMENNTRVAEMFYFPQAGTNIFANITARF